MHDLLGDNPFDITHPEGLVFAAGAGLLDDKERCACACPCDRAVVCAGDECDACHEGHHRDRFDQDDER